MDEDEGDRGRLRAKEDLMQIRVLGSSGGIGNGARTTSLLVDSDILVDAGTGVADLSLDALAAIDHVFLTHAHLDHVTCLPFMLDSVGSHRTHPLVVHAQEATLAVLREHLFNNRLWPDFSAIPSRERPFLRYQSLAPGQTLTLGTRQFQSIPVTHSIPAVGYLIGNGRASIAFSGDTGATEQYWQKLNDCPDLAHVVIETSFVDSEEELARVSGHLCPRLVAAELRKLRKPVPVYITHLMPGEEEQILAEIRAHVPERSVQPFRRDMVISL